MYSPVATTSNSDCWRKVAATGLYIRNLVLDPDICRNMHGFNAEVRSNLMHRFDQQIGAQVRATHFDAFTRKILCHRQSYAAGGSGNDCNTSS